MKPNQLSSRGMSSETGGRVHFQTGGWQFPLLSTGAYKTPPHIFTGLRAASPRCHGRGMDEVSSKEKDMNSNFAALEAVRKGDLKGLKGILGLFLLDGLDEEGNEIWASEWDPDNQEVKLAPAIRAAEVAVRFTREGTPARRRAEKVLLLTRRSKNFRDDYRINRARREEWYGE